MIEPVEAAKWILVIFIAGFIGYFGKYLSKLVIARLHKKKPAEKPVEEKPQKSKDEIDYDLEKKRLKLEKKRIKAQKKGSK